MKLHPLHARLARIVARIRHDPRHADGFEPSLAIRLEYVREILETVSTHILASTTSDEASETGRKPTLEPKIEEAMIGQLLARTCREARVIDYKSRAAGEGVEP